MYRFFLDLLTLATFMLAGVCCTLFLYVITESMR